LLEGNEISLLEEKYGKGDREIDGLEVTLPGKIKENESQGEYAEAIKKLKKKLQGSQFHRKHEEAALHGQIEEQDIKLIEKDSDKEKLNTILYVRIKDLEKQLQLKDVEMEQLETALQGKGV